jgi:predicted RNase H-like HicB family nuclease
MRCIMKKDLEYYLSLPYRIEVKPIPDEEGGGFIVRMPQFGVLGVIGDGESPEEALRDLDENKRLRFAKHLSEGFEIPGPTT